MSTHTTTVSDLLKAVMTGDPWHADSVKAVLAGVTAADARRRPVAGAHSMWELVVHMTGWAHEVGARLGGAPAQEPAGGDWPQIADTSDAAWAAAVRALFAAHAALADTVASMSDPAVDLPVLDRRDRAAGTGLSKLMTLHGLVHHTVYHAGQIALLKKALADSPAIRAT